MTTLASLPCTATFLLPAGRTCSSATDVACKVVVSLLNVLFPDLFIERFCMTGGSSPIGYLKAWHTNLYLSADAEKVREALAEGERRFHFCQQL